MLKNIPSILSPDLLKILMEMGHGDEIVLSDGNFPASGTAKRLVRMDGHDISTLLNAILQFLPLDTFVATPVSLMDVPATEPRPPVWQQYHDIVERHEPGSQFEHVERFEFYRRSAQAYAIVATGERALYANIILKKGVVKEA